MSWLHPSQILYCDTDSCVWIYDPDNLFHKNKDNNAQDLPADVRFGDGLGMWTDELDGKHLTEIVNGGAKSYAHKFSDGKIVIKQKGITLDKANCDLVNFETMKNMVSTNEKNKSASRFQFFWDKQTKNIITSQTARSVSSIINSKRDLNGYDTRPFGFVE